MCVMDTSFLDDRITATKELIVSYEGALAACASEEMQSYTLNTGQTIQTANLKNEQAITNVLGRLMNQLVVLEARRYGSAVQVRPSY